MSMTAAADQARAHALIDDLPGPPDQASDRTVAVLHAHAAALAWVRDTLAVGLPVLTADPERYAGTGIDVLTL
jgi:hypothetical protein